MFSAINSYAIRYEIDDLELFERFRRLVRAMDGIFLEHMNKKES